MPTLRPAGLAVSLAILLAATGCGRWARSIRLDRQALVAEGSDATVRVLADGQPRTLPLACVRPLGVDGALAEASYRFDSPGTWNGAGPCQRIDMAYARVLSAWQAAPGWHEAEVVFIADEPADTWWLLGGLAIGAAGGGALGHQVADCEPGPGKSCQDSGAVQALGVLLGTGVGALVGMVAGWAGHEATRPMYRVGK